MIRRVLVLLLLVTASVTVFAQADSTPHLRISLLTCGPGDEEVYEVFGHTGVRVIDSVQHTDVVYGYGTFAYGPDFELQFMRGKLLYYISACTFHDFMSEYIEAKRSVHEQVLLVDWKKKEQIYSFLEWNLDPENKFYKYDFFFDNCATRIRDIFTRPEVFGNNFHYGNVLPADKKITFRDIINQYFYKDHWTRLGVNILLGSKIDRPMTNSDVMFLPDYLRDGLAGATVNGQKVSSAPELILPSRTDTKAGINQGLLLTTLLAILTILGMTVSKLRVLGKIMSTLLLFVTGLLGCLILVMWFGTDHQGCTNNFNILWCLPLNVFIAFFNPKGKPRYALIAIILIIVSFLLHIFKIQALIIEFVPLLLALLFIFGMIYRKDKLKTANQ